MTFQEFLAAKAIAARLEDEQERLLFADPNKLYLPDWREVGLLLAGSLHQQGKAKVDGLVSRLLDGLGPSPSLADRARCAGLIGGLLRDLAPLDYQVSDPRYATLLDAVQAIFDRQRSQTVPIEERIAAADAMGQAGDHRIDFTREDYWVNIPAGTFWMGSQKDDPKKPNYDPEMYEDEGPVHEVYLDAYRIARYPVTVGQYVRFVEDEGYEDQRWWTAGGFGQFTQPDGWDAQLQFPSRPVVSVSWFEAAAFCAWARCRLPTEAECERAARGTEGRRYPWGSEPADPSRLNFRDSKIGHPTPVGIYPIGATPEGTRDMAGNVLEWCEDWYQRYTAERVSNPRGPQQATYRVYRGGGWASDAGFCRSAYRYDWSVPAYRLEFVGFRVAAVPSGRQARSKNRPAEPGAEAEGAKGRPPPPPRAGAEGGAHG